jgi:hypothetical protein
MEFIQFIAPHKPLSLRVAGKVLIPFILTDPSFHCLSRAYAAYSVLKGNIVTIHLDHHLLANGQQSRPNRP